MNIQLSGEGVVELIGSFTGLFQALTDYLNAAAKKARFEADYLDKKLPQTLKEIETDLQLSEKELEVRRRTVSLMEAEMKAKELKAEADIKEAQLRIKVADVRAKQLNKPQPQKPYNKPSGDGKLPNKQHEKKGGELKGGSEGPSNMEPGLKFKPFSEVIALKPTTTQPT